MRPRIIAVIGLVAALLGGCGGDGGNPGSNNNPALTLSIVEPMGGTAVTVPFTVKVTSSVPLGAITTGQHHVHVYFDDNTAEYTLGESDTVQITKAPTGSHRLRVSLRNADHTAAGADTEVMVIVSGGGTSGTPTPGPSGSDDGDYRY
jgi:hypothetical protein